MSSAQSLLSRKGKMEFLFVFTRQGPPSGLVDPNPALPRFHRWTCLHRQWGSQRGWRTCREPPLAIQWEDFILHPSLPSTGWILLVNNILRHLSSLGEVCSQLLYRASREQPAHGAGTQWLLYAIRPKRHPVGGQRRDYQRVYLGVLGKIKWVRTRR